MRVRIDERDYKLMNDSKCWWMIVNIDEWE